MFKPAITGPGKIRWGGADNVRALSMLAIFTFHACTVLHHEEPRFLVDLCRFGSDLFLLLSGCLIYQSVTGSGSKYSEFIERRIRRIYPVFLAILGFYLLVLYPVFPAYSKISGGPYEVFLTIAANVTLLPLAFGVTPIITVSWTLGYIFLFYVVGYPIIRWTQPSPPAHRIWMWSALVILTFLIAGRAAMLPLGIILAETLRRSRLPLWALTLCAAATARCFPVEKHVQLVCVGIAAFAFCWWMLPLSWNSLPARLLSKISYSFYLTHGLAILGVARLALPPVMAIPAAFAAAIGLSSLVYVAVERPFLQLENFRHAAPPVSLDSGAAG